jgi:hypothetical protein
MIRNLARRSIVAVASVSEHFLMIAGGLPGPVIETRHTLIHCLVTENEPARNPAADVLFCDSIVFARLTASRRRKNLVAYNVVSPECLDQIASAIGAAN